MPTQFSFAAPAAAELQGRVAKVLALMEAQGLTTFVFVDPDNIFWLTNFANFIHERPFVLVLREDGSLHFVVPELEVPHVRSRAVAPVKAAPYFEFPAPKGQGWQAALLLLVEGAKSIGIEQTCPEFIRAVLPSQPVATEIAEDARQVKSSYEIARIRYNCAIATDCMKDLLKRASPNRSALSVHSRVNKRALLRLLDDNPQVNMLATRFAGVVQPPAVSFDPHNFTSVFNLGFAPGGSNTAIVAGVLDGYGAEVERSFFLGAPPPAAVKPFETMMDARRLAFDMCRPGVSMHDLDAAVNGIMRGAGYADNLLHRTGHGIGVTAHEGPFLAEGYHHEIRPGMIFTIEPGIYIEGLGGFRHSDTVLVTETGCESLTSLPDSLSDMTLPLSLGVRLGLPNLQKPLMRFAARLGGAKLKD
jgi:Xaa-Pro dipeptidase